MVVQFAGKDDVPGFFNAHPHLDGGSIKQATNYTCREQSSSCTFSSSSSSCSSPETRVDGGAAAGFYAAGTSGTVSRFKAGLATVVPSELCLQAQTLLQKEAEIRDSPSVTCSCVCCCWGKQPRGGMVLTWLAPKIQPARHCQYVQNHVWDPQYDF